MRNRIHAVVLGVLGFASSASATPTIADGDWWLATAQENGNEVIYRVRASLPDDAVKSRYPWLAVIDWNYLPQSNGMPQRDVARQLYDFEDIVERKIESTGACVQAYARTGNGNKQWNYYVTDRDAFMVLFNASMQNEPKLPITIHFYSDRSWNALKQMHESAGR